jgi:hypothetical protein
MLLQNLRSVAPTMIEWHLCVLLTSDTWVVCRPLERSMTTSLRRNEENSHIIPAIALLFESNELARLSSSICGSVVLDAWPRGAKVNSCIRGDGNLTMFYTFKTGYFQYPSVYKFRTEECHGTIQALVTASCPHSL